MNIYLMIIILIANIIGISIIYQFIKKLEKKEKIIFIAVSVAIVYILILIVYWISGFNIDKSIHEQSKDFITYIFVPVNVILFVPYIASGYMKYRDKKISAEKFIKRVFKISIFAIIVLIIEFFYFKNIQLNIKQMVYETQSNIIVNEEIENVLNEQNEVNEISNENINNVIINTINNTIM